MAKTYGSKRMTRCQPRSSYRRSNKVPRSLPLQPRNRVADTTVGDVVNYVTDGFKYIRSVINSETFYFDAATSGNVPNSGLLINYANIAQGDTQSTRTGSSILVNRIFKRFSLSIHASATNTFVRHIVFIDMQQIKDTDPVITDLLAATSHLAPLSVTNGYGRFKVLKDTTYRLDQKSTPTVFSNFKIDMQHHVKFNGANQGDIQKGGIYEFWISNEATNVPVLDYYNRTSFHDN